MKLQHKNPYDSLVVGILLGLRPRDREMLFYLLERLAASPGGVTRLRRLLAAAEN